MREWDIPSSNSPCRNSTLPGCCLSLPCHLQSLKDLSQRAGLRVFVVGSTFDAFWFSALNATHSTSSERNTAAERTSVLGHAFKVEFCRTDQGTSLKVDSSKLEVDQSSASSLVMKLQIAAGYGGYMNSTTLSIQRGLTCAVVNSKRCLFLRSRASICQSFLQELPSGLVISSSYLADRTSMQHAYFFTVPALLHGANLAVDTVRAASAHHGILIRVCTGKHVAPSRQSGEHVSSS